MTSIAHTQVDGCGGYHRSLGRVGADWAETRTRIDEAASQIRPFLGHRSVRHGSGPNEPCDRRPPVRFPSRDRARLPSTATVSFRRGRHEFLEVHPFWSSVSDWTGTEAREIANAYFTLIGGIRRLRMVTYRVSAVTNENFPSRTVPAETPAQRAFGLRSLSGGPATVQP